MAEYESTSHPYKVRKSGKHKGKACSISKHRKVWMQHHGEIPKGMMIHHINGDKKDNRIENLECISHSDHTKLHNVELCELP